MNWINDEYRTVDTPFNIEAILRADDKLYAEWKKEPFYIDKDKDGNIFINYKLPEPNEAER